MAPKERLPILLWGDLVKHGRPVLRRALAGNDAHEAMYAWVYLTDYMALRRLKEDLAGKDLFRLTESLFNDFDSVIWQILDRARIDPHFQVNKDAFEPMAHLMAICATQNASAPVLVELGSTFFAAIEKFDILDLVTRACIPRWPAIKPAWVGIDNATFSNDVAGALHADRAIRIVEDWAQFKRDDRPTFFYSRFVASYAFPSSETFAQFLVRNCDGAVIEDPYATQDADVPIYNHGQAETFFSFPTVMRILQQNGFQVFVLSHYPDYPGGAAPCHVIRYAVVKQSTDLTAYAENLAKLGWTFDPTARPADAAETLARLNAQLSPEDWAQVKRQKQISPVWGPTALTKPRTMADHIRAMIDRVRQKLVIRRLGWGRTRLSGPMVDQELTKHLDK